MTDPTQKSTLVEELDQAIDTLQYISRVSVIVPQMRHLEHNLNELNERLEAAKQKAIRLQIAPKSDSTEHVSNTAQRSKRKREDQERENTVGAAKLNSSQLSTTAVEESAPEAGSGEGLGDDEILSKIEFLNGTSSDSDRASTFPTLNVVNKLML